MSSFSVIDEKPGACLNLRYQSLTRLKIVFTFPDTWLISHYRKVFICYIFLDVINLES